MQRHRRLLLIALMVYLWLLPAAAPALASARVSVLLVKGNEKVPAYQTAIQGFRATLEPSFFSVSTFHISSELTRAQNEREIERIRNKIVAERPDVILALGEKPLAVANAFILPALPNAKLVFALAFTPTTYPLGDRVFGVALDVPTAMIVEDIRALLPNARRIGVLYSERDSGARFEALEQAVANANLTDLALRNDPRKLQVTARKVAAETDVPRMRDQLLEAGIDVFVYLNDPLVWFEATKRIIHFASRRGVPFVGISVGQLEQGALWVRAAIPDTEDCSEIGREAALLARDAMAPGTVVSNPLQSFSKPLLLFNKSMADAFGLRIPPQGQARIDRTVE